MTNPGRRIATRQALKRPLEARLLLCRGDMVGGWIVDEQDDGLGMVFGAADVPRVEEHQACCVGGPADLFLQHPQNDARPVPVRLAHVTRPDEKQEVRAGLEFDVGRMRSKDVARLLRIWRHMETLA
jgi:hypothetical protein